MTQAEYARALQIVSSYENKKVEFESPQGFVMTIMFYDSEPHRFMRLLKPKAYDLIYREAAKRALDEFGSQLDQMATANRAFRRLLSPSFQQELNERLPWPKRKLLFSEFAKITRPTSDKWSLFQPFDNLNERQMKAVLFALNEVERHGLASISKEHRILILSAGATGYFARKLPQKAK